MAAIGRLPETLADRCILIPMQRKKLAENCERIRHLETGVLRRQAARFVLDRREAIAQARPELPEELNDRAGDIWEPLLVLADLAGGDWPEKARRAAIALTERAQETSPIAGLFLAISAVFTIKASPQIFTRTLVDELNKLPHQLWSPLTRGKPLSERWLAQLLRPYGITPKILSFPGNRARGYEEKDFHEPFRRYVTRAQAEALLAGFDHPLMARGAGCWSSRRLAVSDDLRLRSALPVRAARVVRT